MISFIIIGRNEGCKLKKCFDSVCKTIEYNQLKEYEVIYVDSKSEDNSIEIAKSFQQIKIFQLTADYNAAIARNLGVEKAEGEVIFFIDGDMEIQASFLKEIYDEERSLKYDFVSGDFLDKYYDYNGNLIDEKKYFNNSRIIVQQEVGGLFLLKKEIWQRAGGMRNIFKRSQDIDLALRLAKKKIFLMRLPTVAAHHHTISYRNHKRKWLMIFNLGELFGRSLLYRKNCSNKYSYKRALKNDYSMVILLLSFLSLFILDYLIISFSIYLAVIAYRSFKYSNKTRSFVENVFYYSVRDIITILGFLFFFPKSPQNIHYKIIQ